MYLLQHYLLQKGEVPMDDGDFEYWFNKQHVLMLLEKLEEQNGDLADQVMKMEAELLEEAKSVQTGKQKQI